METKEAIEKSMEIVANTPTNKWPEDDWIAIDEGWDLNLYGDEDYQGATLHPVYDGNTCTSTAYVIQ